MGIELELDRARRVVEIHAADLKISGVRAKTSTGALRGAATPVPQRETVALRFETPLPRGRVRLELSFAGRLRDDLCGLYTTSAGGRRFAFTQLETANARRFFPCFDEPAIKARYQISVTTDPDEAVVSNGPVESTSFDGAGLKTVHFARTRPLSTYIVALAVGDLENSSATFAGSTEIRVWHVRGKRGLSDFALECARETLVRLESYFDLPYPYAKLDLIAVPDFQFGGMENAGAVFFRETLLLLDPVTSTLAERKRVAEVVCHELAHMWYGNLVTMGWWDDLWLNEAFATWMAFRIVDGWRPEWGMWKDFLHQRAAALGVDALAHTHAIYAPVKAPDDAWANFDLITYEKGAAVLRMLEHYLGADAFKNGVRLYIERHRDSSAVAADLWQALSKASGEQVGPVVRAWIEQEGHPVVRVRRVDSKGEAAIELSQERSTLRPRSDKARTRPTWPVPWVGRIGHGADERKSHTVRHLLRKVRDRIPAQGADLTFVYGNADEGGFFRPLHDPADLDDIFEDLSSLSALERMGLVDHQWAFVRSGHAPMASLLDLIARLGTEPDHHVLATVRRPLEILVRRLAPDVGAEIEERLRAWIEVYYGGQVDDLGWEPAQDEPDETRLRRAEVLSIVGGIGRATAVLEHADEWCQRYLADRNAVDAELVDVVVALASSRGGDALYQQILDGIATASTPQEHRRFLLSLADFRAPGLVDRTCGLLLGDGVARQDVVLVLTRLLANRDARERTWRFAKKRWPALRGRMGPMLAGRFIEATPALASAAHRRDVARFFRAHPVPTANRALKQALERFDWYAGYRRRAGPELASYLSG